MSSSLPPPKSILEKQALKNGFNVWTEAFMDRAYQDDGQLVSRSKKKCNTQRT
jgi:lactam utilization protein B